MLLVILNYTVADGNVFAFYALYSSKTLKNDKLRSKFFELVASYQKLHIKERKKATNASTKANESSVTSCF